jgi:hypothetical protein
MSTDREEKLEHLDMLLMMFHIDDGSAFAILLAATLDALNITPEQAADELKVSKPTIHRWCNGKSLPVRAMRVPVLGWILNRRIQEDS